MTTLKDDFVDSANGSPIEAVIVGEMGWPDYGNDERHEPGLSRKGEILSWEEAAPLLDYEYDSGYGAPDCQAVWAWTKDSVLFIVEYDGSTYISSIPRNPEEGIPSMPGG